MADTLNITEGTGTTIATQDEGSVHYQEIKLTASGSGTTEALSKAEDSAHASGNHGIMALTVRQDTAASLSGTDADYQPLITDANGRLHVLDQNSAAMLTAVQLIDDAVYIDDADWSDGSSKHLLVGGLYQSSPQTITDGDVGPLEIDVNGKLIVVVNSLPASTNTIEVVGDVAENANAAGNPLLCGGRYDSSPRTLGNTDVGAIALAADGAVHIDDGGNTITIDGTVTANLSSTDNTVLDNIQTAAELIDDAIYVDDADWSDGSSKHMLVGGLYQSSPQSITDGDVGPLQVDADGALHISDGGNTITIDGDVGTVTTVTTVSTVTNLAQLGGTAITMDEGVHDAGCQRVTIATDDDGVAHLATIAGDTTNIETAIQIIDDWDSVHASAATTDGPQVMGAAYSTALPTDVGADADAARLVTDRYGRLCTGLQPQAAKATLDNADTTTAREVVAATATRKIFVTSLILSVDTAGNYWLEDGDATQVTGKFYLAANGGVAVTFPEGTPLQTATQNKALNVKGSTAGNVSVTVTYYLAV